MKEPLNQFADRIIRNSEVAEFIQDLIEKGVPPERIVEATKPKPPAMTIIHFMGHGMTACMKPGPPAAWEEGHVWSSEWKDVTCAVCLKGRAPVETYIISHDGKSITCKRCGRMSHNPNDVAYLYCGHCHVFHDDLWPPARQWWIDNPPMIGCRCCGGYDAHKADCPYQTAKIPHPDRI
jgi:hypothetical protein